MQNALADIGHLASIVDFSMVRVEDLMLAHSVLWTGEPHSLDYIASIYGALNRYKHLSLGDPLFYSAMDAYEPMYIWRYGIFPEFKADRLSYKLYKERRLPLIGIIARSQAHGIRINSKRLLEVKRIYQGRLDEIQAEARVLTGDEKFNIGGQKKVREEIYGE
jgi:DNA polymerase I-like protein with 3'-5' exonuclease and polymerase domains